MNTLIKLNESFIEGKKTFLSKFDQQSESEKFNRYYTLEIGWMNTLLQENKDLQTCDPISLKKVLQNVVTSGLTLSPAMKECYIIKRGNLATLEISYIGLIKLLTDAGTVSKIEAHVIHENDHKEHSLGLEPKLIHEPVFTNRGERVAVYAVATMRDGSQQYEMLYKEDIDDIKSVSPSANSTNSPWRKFESQMWRKSAIKRLFHYLPKTNLSDELIAALSIEHSNDISYIAPHNEEETKEIFAPEPKKETKLKTETKKKTPTKKAPKKEAPEVTPETNIIDEATKIIDETIISDNKPPINGSDSAPDNGIQISKDNKNIFGNNGDELGNFLNLLK